MKNKLAVGAAVSALLLFGGAAAQADGCSIPKEKLGKIGGRVQIVQENADYRVRVIKEGFPDLRVKLVDKAEGAKAGVWQIVDSDPDFTIRYDSGNPDFTIIFVEDRPGVQP